MQINISRNSYFIFDLDDTLVYEADFLKSAFNSIARQLLPVTKVFIYNDMLNRYKLRQNVFDWIISEYGSGAPHLTKTWLLDEYRNHMPVLSARPDALRFLHRLKTLDIPAGLLTDGRSVSQRNKLAAAGIGELFTDIIISEEFGSEKTDVRNYEYFLEKYPERKFFLVGDNTAKDFKIPGKLGWTTICIRDAGDNIHPQNFGGEAVPKFIVSSLDEIDFHFMELAAAN